MVRMLTEEFATGAPHLPRVRRALVAGLACALLAGCGTTYVMQAASGQLRVLHARVPIEKAIADPRTSASVRAQLEQVQAAREFASQQLGLPDNKSYRSFADIGRPFVVWSVVATPEFSIAPEHWCFPVAGCVAYRGYFHEEAARKFAFEMSAKGFDVTVGGVPAYSTLGKFSDPVLSSMLRYGNDSLAAMIFHELAHQLLYVRDDSAFNEAFATTVEDAGLARWIAHQGGGMRIREYRDEQAREAGSVKILSATRARLGQLYASGVPVPIMRERKRQILAELAAQIRAAEYREKVTYPLYDEWIAEGLNNAQLASIATYYDCVPGFKRLLAESGDDLQRFYAAARAVSKLPRSQRHAQLCTASGAQAAEPGGPAD